MISLSFSINRSQEVITSKCWLVELEILKKRYRGEAKSMGQVYNQSNEYGSSVVQQKYEAEVQRSSPL